MASAAAKRGRNEPPPPVIVKKVIVVKADGHHGGSWKVAYADFVTAMMAFFLLLWLLGATDENQRKGLADYFTPTLVKMREQSAGSGGMLGGSSITDADNYQHRAGQTGTRSLTIPRDAKGGPREGGADRDKKADMVRKQLEQKLSQSPAMKRLMRQVRVVETTEGIRIDLVDDADFSMFQLGTTLLTPEASQLIVALAETVEPQDGGLVIRGHTDALPWKNGVVANNWSLSAGRAEATRQALIRDGVDMSRFRKIEGVADREPLVRGNPADPRNRRISILMTR